MQTRFAYGPSEKRVWHFFGISSTENQHQGGNADELYYWEPCKNLQLILTELDQVIQFWCSSLHSHLSINKKALKVIIYEKLHEKSTTQNHMDYDHNFVLNTSQEGNMKK